MLQAEVHQDRATTNQNTADNLNLDTIDIALDIAKDAALVKSDIKRIEEIILNTKTHKQKSTILIIKLYTRKYIKK